MYQQDWIMRQVQMLVQFIAKLVWKKDTIEYRVVDENNLSDTDLLYYELEKLLAHSNICEAENLLFERMDKNNNKYLELAINFYQEVNKLTNEDLQAANFGRDEIYFGLNEIIQTFGLPKSPL